ncbi:MAG TPA: hypothetical protein VG326_12025 [Tepidisphaeraceae bacterium]|jgi:hypothetical protein|nr:hypothetical protein [Tepidisphaeraceae bacterium]
MSRKLELSWIASLKQWRKRRMVDGKTKTFYLGTGTGKADLDSYERALAKWNEIERGINVANEENRYAAWHDQISKSHPHLFLPKTRVK